MSKASKFARAKVCMDLVQQYNGPVIAAIDARKATVECLERFANTQENPVAMKTCADLISHHSYYISMFRYECPTALLQSDGQCDQSNISTLSKVMMHMDDCIKVLEPLDSRALEVCNDVYKLQQPAWLCTPKDHINHSFQNDLNDIDYCVKALSDLVEGF
jgi:hypothetical protein